MSRRELFAAGIEEPARQVAARAMENAMKDELKIFREATRSAQAKFILATEDVIREEKKRLKRFKRIYRKKSPAIKDGEVVR